ncbi:MAG: hypothetical protein LUI10_12320 [Lachnospiraceae bacterium]|nr:hypothetical protein [Lachnospiraceae bacterium]
MKEKNKKLLALLTIVLIVVIVALILIGSNFRSRNAWQEQYDLGIQYLTDGDYSAAVVALTAAIETEPKRAALYIARGDAYSAWAEETAAAALVALTGEEMLEWSEITVTADDGSTYTLEELYENAISDYEEAIRLIEGGEAVDNSSEELLQEADEKLKEIKDRFDESREEYTEKLNELNSSGDEAAVQADGTGNSGDEESEEAVELKPEYTVDISLIYKSYEDCSEEEQSVLTMLVDAAENGDPDSLPTLSEIPEVIGYYYIDGYRVHITREYDKIEYSSEIYDYSAYMLVSLRPESGMGYAYFIWEQSAISELNKRGIKNFAYDYCYHITDYIACPCEDWNWNGEYTETYILNDVLDGNRNSGYETGNATDNLLNGTISTTVTTSETVYTWTRTYIDGIITDSSGEEGGWDEYYYSTDMSDYLKKYFWLDEAAYCIVREYDTNDNLTAKFTYSSAGVLMWYQLYLYDEDGNYQGYDKYYADGRGSISVRR